MKWSEVKALHPDKFVLLENLKEHIDGNYKYIDEVALIDVIDDNKEASDLVYGLIEFIKAMTKLIDELIKLKSSIHKLKNHPDGSQSDSDNK